MVHNAQSVHSVTSALLDVRFLGTFEIRLRGRLVTGFESAKVRALLAYLILEGDRLHTRAYLASLLWPDEGRQARQSLRQALFNLRKALGGKPDADLFLESGRQYIRFRPESPTWVDVNEFLSLVDAPNADVSPDDLERAFALYRGDLLQGLTVSASSEFDNWLTSRREHLHRLALRGLQQLAHWYEEHRDYARAEQAVRRLIALEPWNEAGHRQLMHLLLLQGQRSAALRQYEQCRAVLLEEFGTEPSQETLALYEEIRAFQIHRPQSRAPFTVKRRLSRRPVPLEFVGREKELIHIAQRLADPSCRLLTIVGMGGIGKSTLARQAIRLHEHEFEHGAAFVPLDTVDSPDLIPEAIARVLGLTPDNTSTPREQVLKFLAEKELLLVLDNFEHLLDGAEVVLDILQRAPWVKIIVTSREPLHLHQEWLLPLMGLSYPHTDRLVDLSRYDAVRWFVESAKRVQPDFVLTPEVESAVVRICRHVQGSPLGIQLATSWLSTMSCADIAQAIEEDLDFLSTPMRDMPERHRSMRVVIGHSWERLSQEERRVFSRLGVFLGSFTVQAAATITEARLSTLATLVGRSMVSIEQQGKYALHPVLRQYALDKLKEHPEEESRVRELHARYMLQLVGRLLPSLLGSEQQQALEQIDAHLADIRAAWRWAVKHKAFNLLDSPLEALYHYYEIRGGWQEARLLLAETANYFETQVSELSSPEQLRCYGRVLTAQAWFELRLIRTQAALKSIEMGAELLQRYGTRKDWAFCLAVKGIVAKEQGEYKEGIALLQEALDIFQVLNEPFYIAQSLMWLASIRDTAGEEIYELMPLFEQALAIYRELDNPRGIAYALTAVANAAYSLGRYEQAEAAYEEALKVRASLGDRLGSAVLLNNLGSIAYMRGQLKRAKELFEESARAFREMGGSTGWAYATINLGQIAEVEGKYEEALHHYLLALGTYRMVRHRWSIALSLSYVAHAYVLLHQLPRAKEAVLEALDIASTLQSMPLTLRVFWSTGHYLLAVGQVEKGSTLLAYVLAHPVADDELKAHVKRVFEAHEVTIPASVLTEMYQKPQNISLQTLETQVYNWVLAAQTRAA